MRLALMLGLTIIVVAMTACGAADHSTSVQIVATNPDAGRAVFAFSCNPPRGNVGLPWQACSGVLKDPALVEHPLSVDGCFGLISTGWQLTIHGRIRGKRFHSAVSTCWRGRMISELTLPNPWEHLVSGPAR